MSVSDKIMDMVDSILPELVERTVKRLYFVTSDLHAVQEKRELAKLEQLLYSKTQIEDCLAENVEELAQLELGIRTKKTSSDVLMYSQNKLTESQIIEGKILSLQLKIERDTRKIEGLVAGMDDWRIKGHKFYEILDYKYNKFMTDEEIANIYGFTAETIRIRRLELLRLIYHRIEGAKGL